MISSAVFRAGYLEGFGPWAKSSRSCGRRRSRGIVLSASALRALARDRLRARWLSGRSRGAARRRVDRLIASTQACPRSSRRFFAATASMWFRDAPAGRRQHVKGPAERRGQGGRDRELRCPLQLLRSRSNSEIPWPIARGERVPAGSGHHDRRVAEVRRTRSVPPPKSRARSSPSVVGSRGVSDAVVVARRSRSQVCVGVADLAAQRRC